MIPPIPVTYWHKLQDDRIQCDLCPRFCKLKEGQRGLCFVRARQNHKMVLTTYGRSSGFCIDPMEKKPLNHFFPGSPVLSFGTSGCNLTCKFCQNWDISKSREMETLSEEASPELIGHIAKKTECMSVAFTYNDPVIFLEYAVDTAKICHNLGIYTVAVTAGMILEAPRKDFFEHIDATNVDLKSFSSDFYKKHCSGNLETVLDTLCYLKKETNVWLEITTLLIPGENDSKKEIDEMTKWIAKELDPFVPLHFSAFHPAYRMMNKRQTPIETLIMAREIALKNGLHYVYTGNVHHQEGDITYCHSCKKEIIVRDWYEIISWNLDSKGACTYCGAPCSGRFLDSHGTWGRKRQPISIQKYKS